MSDRERRPERRTLVLAPLTVPGAAPLELIEAAAAGGFTAITLSVLPATRQHTIRPILGDEPLRAQIKSRLDELGIALLDIGGLWFRPDTDVQAYLPAFEFGARMGAKHFIVAGDDALESRLLDNFGRTCELTRQFGLQVVLEFIPYCRTGTLADALRLIVTADQPNCGILVDALHLSRSGGSPADLRGVNRERISYCQLCDATQKAPAASELPVESRTARLYPGLGALPLIELLDALPPDIPIGVEAPCAAYAHLSVTERGRLCGLATRVFLNSYDDHRALAGNRST